MQWLCESTIARIGEEDGMKRRHHSPEQIVRKLRETDRLLGEGILVLEECRHLKADDGKRLKELLKENARLKPLVADQALCIDMLKRCVHREDFEVRLAAGPRLLT